MRSTTWWGALFAALVACGGGDGSSYGGDGSGGTPPPAPGGTPSVAQHVITVQGMAFRPLRLEVPPGATVTVRNLDDMAHSVTSESAPNEFRPGAASGISFDTGAFTGERTLAIPANAPSGATVPYYCSTHLGTMATPNGEIAIAASPAAGSGTPTTPSMPTSPGTGPYGRE